MTQINLSKSIGSPFCVSNEDGLMVHARIVECFARGEQVEISFAGVSRLTTAFLNAALGQLYDEYPVQTITQLLHIVDTTIGQAAQIRRTTDNAQVFFKNPQMRRHVLREALKDGE